MGNYVSCSLAAASHPKSTRIILPFSSDIRRIGAAHTTAAEVMLDFPGHFLVSSRSLRIGARFNALSADEDLEPGHVYVMFPMARVSSVVGAADMAPLVLAAGKAVRKASGGSARVLPELVTAPATPPMESLNVEFEDEMVAEFRNRLSLCRSRRPRLETIAEESCAC